MKQPLSFISHIRSYFPCISKKSRIIVFCYLVIARIDIGSILVQFNPHFWSVWKITGSTDKPNHAVKLVIDPMLIARDSVKILDPKDPISSVLVNDPQMMTISLGASMFRGQYSMDYSGMIAATVIIIIPQLLFYLLFQKNIVEGMTAGAVKG